MPKVLAGALIAFFPVVVTDHYSDGKTHSWTATRSPPAARPNATIRTPTRWRLDGAARAARPLCRPKKEQRLPRRRPRRVGTEFAPETLWIGLSGRPLRRPPLGLAAPPSFRESDVNGGRFALA